MAQSFSTPQRQPLQQFMPKTEQTMQQAVRGQLGAVQTPGQTAIGGDLAQQRVLANMVQAQAGATPAGMNGVMPEGWFQSVFGAIGSLQIGDGSGRTRLGVNGYAAGGGGRAGLNMAAVTAYARQANVPVSVMAGLLQKVQNGTLQAQDMMAVVGVPPVLLPRELGGLGDQAATVHDPTRAVGIGIGPVNPLGYLPFGTTDISSFALGGIFPFPYGFDWVKWMKQWKRRRDALIHAILEKILYVNDAYEDSVRAGDSQICSDLFAYLMGWLFRVKSSLENNLPFKHSDVNRQEIVSIVGALRAMVQSRAVNRDVGLQDCKTLLAQLKGKHPGLIGLDPDDAVYQGVLTCMYTRLVHVFANEESVDAEAEYDALGDLDEFLG